MHALDQKFRLWLQGPKRWLLDQAWQRHVQISRADRLEVL
jgi:hypothetical protein